MMLRMSGMGTITFDVNNNLFVANNGLVDREFFAEFLDFAGPATICIPLDGNFSANLLGPGPPSNYDFFNENGTAAFTVNVGTNFGTVDMDPDVVFGTCP